MIFYSFFHSFILFRAAVCLASSFFAEHPLFPSPSLSLFRLDTRTNTREEVKEVLFKTGGGRLEESFLFFFW